MKTKQLIFATSFFLALVFNASAQINFSGTWKIKDSIQFISGPKYINALPKTIVVTQTQDSLILETISNGGKKDLQGRYSYPLNGQELGIESKNGQKKLVRTLGWGEGKQKMVLTSANYVAGDSWMLSLTWIEEWMLSNGLLSITKKSIETQAENWEAKAVYIKQ